MKKDAIANILHTYFLRLKKYFLASEKNTTAETIKPFRIEIKKIRAFLRLLSSETKDPDKLKLPESLKGEYKAGGKFRDLQLHQQRIREAIRKNPSISYDIDNLLKAGRHQLKKEKEGYLSHKKFSAIEKKIKEDLPDKYNIATVKRFFRKKIDAIAAIIAAGTYHDEELHNIRKILKDILYILKLYLLDIKTPLGFRFWNKAELQKAKALEDELGLLNDSHNALALLRSDDINKFSGEEKKLLLSVRRQLLTEKRKLKKQLIHSLTDLALDKP